MVGFVPVFRAYSTLMAENDLSIRIADINSRIISLITAPDDSSKQAADEYLRKIAAGDLSSIQTNPVLETGTKTQPYASGSSLSVSMTSLIELQQYLKAGWNNDVGLNANYNMKRESLNSAESQLNEDALLPTPADMLENRRIALDRINEMFGLNIKVDLASAWKKHETVAENIVEQINGDGEFVDNVEDDLTSAPDEDISEPEEIQEESPEETSEPSEALDEETSDESETTEDVSIEDVIEEIVEDKIEEIIENKEEDDNGEN
jgi:hypothetical protein